MYKSINSLLIENLHLPCCCMFTQGLLRTFWNSPALCISVTIMGIDLTSVYSRMKELTLTKIFISGQELVTFCSKGLVIESYLNTNSLVTLTLNLAIFWLGIEGYVHSRSLTLRLARAKYWGHSAQLFTYDDFTKLIVELSDPSFHLQWISLWDVLPKAAGCAEALLYWWKSALTGLVFLLLRSNQWVVS